MDLSSTFVHLRCTDVYIVAANAYCPHYDELSVDPRLVTTCTLHVRKLVSYTVMGSLPLI